jgi:leader peptidase (prepilin peptidase) / N-methyltransferase
MGVESTMYVTVFVFGLCIGSFLNVCIYRLPASKSIVRPGSGCTACGHPIRWFDNIPILSWLLLRGRCRNCGAAISVRYLMVELLSGLFALICFFKFGPTPAGLVYFSFIAALLVITFIDLDHQIIPNAITLPGIPLCYLGSLAVPWIRWQDGLIGILAGGGVLFSVGWIYSKIKGKQGMGGGDIKLLAMIGALAGLRGVVFTVFVASAVGTLAGVCLMVAARLLDMERRIPFGPFLAIGAIVYLFFGNQLIVWYLSTVF